MITGVRLSVCAWSCIAHHVDISGQHVLLNSSYLSYDFYGLNLGVHAWWQDILLTEAYQWPTH